MMLLRQSTTVPKTSKASARGSVITAPGRPCPCIATVGQALAAPPGRRTAGYRTGGGGRSPASTSCAERRADLGLRARGAVDELTQADADDADVAQQQPVHLDRRDAAAATRNRAPAAGPRWPARGSRRRTRPRRPGRPRRPRRGRRCARGPPAPTRRSAAARRRRRATRRTRSPPGRCTIAITLAPNAFAIWIAAVPDAARRAEHQHRLTGAAAPPRRCQREVHRVVVAQQAHRRRVVDAVGRRHHAAPPAPPPARPTRRAC